MPVSTSASTTSRPSPRILHVCPRPSFSGLEAYALMLAEGQRALGAQVEFVVLKNSPLEERCVQAGIATRTVDSSALGRVKFIAEIGAYLSAKTHPDIVHLHSTQDIDLFLLPLMHTRFCPLRKSRPKVILQTHIWISHTKRDPLHWISYSLIDEVWCSSEPARKTLREFLPIAASKIRVVKYGREIEKMESGFLSRQEAREKLGLPQGATVIGNVARIDEGKGTRELLEGALKAMGKHPDLHLVLIGPPTADDPKAVAFAESLRERIAALPPDRKSRVHAPGAIADSYRILKAFDLFALPTYCECFALSLLEALLAGVPCLATLSGGSPEMVREGETGWLFAPRSADACFDAIERALRDRAQWPSMSVRGQTMVRRDFDFKNILPRTLEHYVSLTTPTLNV